MSPRIRLVLIVIGIALFLFSIAALAYASGPVPALQEHAPLVPTLFVPPS